MLLTMNARCFVEKGKAVGKLGGQRLPYRRSANRIEHSSRREINSSFFEARAGVCVKIQGDSIHDKALGSLVIAVEGYQEAGRLRRRMEIRQDACFLVEDFLTISPSSSLDGEQSVYDWFARTASG